MAVTISTADYRTYSGGKNFEPQALVSQAKKALLYIVKVTFGAGDNYATGGVAISLKDRGAKTYTAVIPIDNDALVVARYDTANEKILMYGEIKDDAAGVNADASAFVELTAASTIPNSKVFTFLVFAQR